MFFRVGFYFFGVAFGFFAPFWGRFWGFLVAFHFLTLFRVILNRYIPLICYLLSFPWCFLSEGFLLAYCVTLFMEYLFGYSLSGLFSVT